MFCNLLPRYSCRVIRWCCEAAGGTAVGVWRTACKIFLESGEAAVLAEAACLAAICPEPHPRQGRLRSVAAVMDALAVGDGLLLQPALASTARQAARRHVLQQIVRIRHNSGN